jgi:hypothetical protein
VARHFKFRVREGTTLFEFGERGKTTHAHEPGYEFVVSEDEAAAILRHGGLRRFDLVEVIYDGPAPVRKLPG